MSGEQLGLGYENAPATKMLATHCAVCGRALVDAVSVDFGVGPECRAKHGFNEHANAEARSAMNKAVHHLALWRKHGTGGAQAAVDALKSVRANGFTKLAEILEQRLCDVVVTEVDEQRLAIATPYSDTFVVAMRRIFGTQWDATRKAWTFPRVGRSLVFGAVRASFPSALGVGPRGVFSVSSA